MSSLIGGNDGGSSRLQISWIPFTKIIHLLIKSYSKVDQVEPFCGPNLSKVVQLDWSFLNPFEP